VYAKGTISGFLRLASAGIEGRQRREIRGASSALIRLPSLLGFAGERRLPASEPFSGFHFVI
jgi:hypothetical protein